MDFVIGEKNPCAVVCGEGESEAVKIAAENLRTDLKKVFGEAVLDDGAESRIVVRTAAGDGMHREQYRMYVKENTLFVEGSDRRGTIYGIYTFCESIGVSPWYFWADVPVKKKSRYVLPSGFRREDYPAVEYRGVFINDEEELEAWVKNRMGEETIGVKTYEKIFELLLRLKANYIWPAMHVNSFNVKRENGALAERMGIVVGTSHCDMLMRSNNREWKPWLAKKGYEGAKYDYSKPGRDREILKEYWRESVEQNKDFEVCYTVGMRGIHDSGFETEAFRGMTGDELKQAKIELLDTVISDQQKLLKEVLGRDTMMTFVPYKEVLPLYDGGLEVPEDITLVWANDNYGYIRRYPSEKEKKRKGGNGIYYHNSYWAPPGMSYVFLCSIPLAHTANELRKAYAEGVRKLWVMNVGAMKPLEQEIEFFLRLAWEIGKEEALTEDVDAYVRDWIDRNFSGGIGEETAGLLNDFSQLTNMRKVEMMDTDVFSQTAYGDEAAVRIHVYEDLFERGNAIYARLPEEERDAYFQMVLMRIHAAYFTNLAYYYGDRSTLMYEQGKMQAAAEYVRRTRELEDARRKMVVYYNKRMAGGKWDGIVNPEGFPPPRAAMMPVCTPPLEIGETGLRVDVWNGESGLKLAGDAVKWIEIGNTGKGSLSFEIKAPEWITLSQTGGKVTTECRVLISAADSVFEEGGMSDGRVDLRNSRRQGVIVVTEKTTGQKAEIPVEVVGQTCTEADGIALVEASSAACADFKQIKRLGRGYGALMEANTSHEPQEILARGAGENAYPYLKYPVTLTSEGEFVMEIHRFPSLNSTGHIRVGVSVDGGEIRLVETEANDEHLGTWRDNVRDNVDRLYLNLPAMSAGEHCIGIHAVDKYFAFSRFVIYTKERRENRFAGAPGVFGQKDRRFQALPKEFDSGKFTGDFYGDMTLPPRPVEYASLENPGDTLAVVDLIKQEEAYAETVTPDFYLRSGGEPFAETEKGVCIDAASALADTENAYREGELWRHCASESYGRSGLAMYIRKQGARWKSCEDAPSLNYRAECLGGDYVLWLLAKFGMKEEFEFGIGVDGRVLEKEELLYKGNFWRYEAEQIYRYFPVAKLSLTKGVHMFSVYAKAAGMRFDRICLTREDKLPPTDSEWR